MMKFHKPGRLRMLGGAAAIATLGGLSLAFGSAGAVAQPAPPAPPAPPSAAAPHAHDNDRHRERVIVRTYRHDEHRGHGGDGARAERRDGASGERREERRVHVITTGDGDGDHHRRVIERHGPGGADAHVMMMGGEECRNANRSEVNEGSGNNITRVIVCSRGSERSAAQRAEALQQARARLAGDNEIPAEHRQRVLAAIDREISRLRGSGQ